MNGISFDSYGNTYQYKLVGPNQYERIFYIKIPKGCVGFIRKIKCNWFPDSYFDFIVDGEKVKKINEAIEEEIKPPILVKDKIEVYVKNNSSESHYFEFRCEGTIYHVKTELNFLK